MKMKVYVTRYALTTGIMEHEVCGRPDDKIIIIRSSGGFSQHMWKPWWYTTREEAIAHAEQMRVKKIASLKKQIAKLEKMTFE